MLPAKKEEKMVHVPDIQQSSEEGEVLAAGFTKRDLLLPQRYRGLF